MNIQSELKEYILKKRILIARLEISLYALPDDFTVCIDDEQYPLATPHKITRNKKSYEVSSDRYKQLVSSTGMYEIIKKHIKYETMQLWKAEARYGKPAHTKDKKLIQYTAMLRQLRVGDGKNIILELQPRWVSRSYDEEDLYEEAVSLVARTQIADVTLIRDNLSIGQTLSDKLMRRLEDEGLVSTLSDKALRRTVFVTVKDMQKREAERHATE